MRVRVGRLMLLLVTVGVVLLSCACTVCCSHLPTEGNVTREPEGARQPSCMSLRSMRADDHQPRDREDVDSLMVFWTSAVAADGVEHAEGFVGSWYSSCGTLPS